MGADRVSSPLCYITIMSHSKSKTEEPNEPGKADLMSVEPGYDAWAKAKIEKALDEAKRHPERRIPLDKVWKKFGLEH